MPTAKTAPKTRWISGRQVAKLGLSRRALPALVRAGFVRSWKLPIPGTRWVKYAEEDVVKLLPGAAPVNRGGAP
jgi:hypothetical protein